MVLVVTVLSFPAASFIWTGYMECIQLSSGSFVWEELVIIQKRGAIESLYLRCINIITCLILNSSKGFLNLYRYKHYLLWYNVISTAWALDRFSATAHIEKVKETLNRTAK